jgi:hypothetical protein
MNFLRKIISESISTVFEVADKSQKQIAIDKLTSILNSLEFKDDIIGADGEIYAVGGIVRDAIMGKQSDDLDIVVRGVSYDKLFAILLKYGKPTDTSTEKEEDMDPRWAALKNLKDNN